MENIIKKIKKGAKHTRLSAVEKAEMRNVLVRHIKANPVDSSVLLARGLPSPFFNINNFRNKKGISILVIGGLLMGGSVSFAAESTVPGDVLYPVKVHVNENLRGAIAVTPKAKADWEVEKAERRLLEVEKLADAPNISPEIKVAAEADFNANTERVQEHIAKFEEDNDSEDAIDTAGKFTEMLRRHEGALGKRNFERTTLASDTASTTEIATTTLVAPVNNAELDDVLQNVRGARGNAEKKQKELKHKYHKEDVKADTFSTPAPASFTVASGTPEQEEVLSENSNNAVGKRWHGRNEEIRTMPSEATSATRPSQMNESSKVDEND